MLAITIVTTIVISARLMDRMLGYKGELKQEVNFLDSLQSNR